VPLEVSGVSTMLKPTLIPFNTKITIDFLLAEPERYLQWETSKLNPKLVIEDIALRARVFKLKPNASGMLQSIIDRGIAPTIPFVACMDKWWLIQKGSTTFRYFISFLSID
jgi:hypothetical protein